jgi:hypothetical protein
MLKSILLFCPAKELELVREVNGLSYNKKIES